MQVVQRCGPCEEHKYEASLAVLRVLAFTTALHAAESPVAYHRRNIVAYMSHQDAVYIARDELSDQGESQTTVEMEDPRYPVGLQDLRPMQVALDDDIGENLTRITIERRKGDTEEDDDDSAFDEGRNRWDGVANDPLYDVPAEILGDDEYSSEEDDEEEEFDFRDSKTDLRLEVRVDVHVEVEYS
ncbi:hypothetical protein WOLCODRAFT_136860 [Wolfiporia cocos MD-104 SS10]|uniref:Uncharacterized protein n=1 Tax=Wolfiporia cocos (strain MD-104) TaxID=742152 RepID=A0A2H3JRL2_WOLCO|nr:hypothetical protein WOLCODRAFT_136860 [Wolfiporia cocos MD-104 SS10]